MAIQITTSVKAGAYVVSVAGEVDVSNASQLRDALDQALEANPSTIEVSLADVPYIDSTGIGVLVGTAHRAADKSIGLVVSNPQHNVERVLNLLGVGKELNVRKD